MKQLKNFSELSEYIQEHNPNSIIAIGGGSGSGKTHLTKQILSECYGIDDERVLDQEGKTSLDTDCFLGKNTNDILQVIKPDVRQEKIADLLTSPHTTKEKIELFKELYRNETGLESLLENIAYAQKNNFGSFSKKKILLYDRDKRVVKPKQLDIKIPAKRPFILNGTNIEAPAKKIAEKANAIISTVHIKTDPHYSLLSALFRDMEKNKLSIPRRGEFRLSDLFHVSKIEELIEDKKIIDAEYKDPEIFKKVLQQLKNTGSINKEKMNNFFVFLDKLQAESQANEAQYTPEIKEYLKKLWRKTTVLKQNHFSEYISD